MTTLLIDERILAVSKPTWQKVAMVVAAASEAIGIGAAEVEGHELIISRIKALVQDGRLVSQGDLSRPRYSEVRPGA